jgi:voltage-gated potassium channel
MTTVGYGDIVPKTPTGRWAAVVIMLTGITVVGLLAGSLASFFRLDKGTSPEVEPTDSDATGSTPDSTTALGALVTEVAALRQQVVLLSERIADLGDSAGQLSPAPRQDEP